MNVQVTRYEHADTHDPAAVVHLYGTDHPTRIGAAFLVLKDAAVAACKTDGTAAEVAAYKMGVEHALEGFGFERLARTEPDPA